MRQDPSRKCKAKQAQAASAARIRGLCHVRSVRGSTARAGSARDLRFFRSYLGPPGAHFGIARGSACDGGTWAPPAGCAIPPDPCGSASLASCWTVARRSARRYGGSKSSAVGTRKLSTAAGARSTCAERNRRGNAPREFAEGMRRENAPRGALAGPARSSWPDHRGSRRARSRAQRGGAVRVASRPPSGGGARRAP